MTKPNNRSMNTTETPKTVWMVKYALTEGIREVETDQRKNISSGFIGLKTGYYGDFKIGRDVTLTREEAVKIAENKRKRRIASLQKQIDALKAKDFTR